MVGMLAENPSDAITSAGGGGRIPGPVKSGITMPKLLPPPPIGGQNQQFRTGMMGQPCESWVAEETSDVVEVVTVLQSTVIVGSGVMVEGGGVKVSVVPLEISVVVVDPGGRIVLEVLGVLLDWVLPAEDPLPIEDALLVALPVVLPVKELPSVLPEEEVLELPAEVVADDRELVDVRKELNDE